MRVYSMIELADKVIADAARWYTMTGIPLYVVETTAAMRTRLTNSDPRTFTIAFEIAGHDMRRMTVAEDGGIIIWNRHQW